MAKNIFKSGKKFRPKTAVKGKRFLCTKCPQAKPETDQDARSMVLPEMFDGRTDE